MSRYIFLFIFSFKYLGRAESFKRVIDTNKCLSSHSTLGSALVRPDKLNITGSGQQLDGKPLRKTQVLK